MRSPPNFISEALIAVQEDVAYLEIYFSWLLLNCDRSLRNKELQSTLGGLPLFSCSTVQAPPGSIDE